MARRRRYSSYSAGPYKFTSRRRAALQRAQAKSARNRRIKVGIMAAGGVAAVGVSAYLGHKHGGAIGSYKPAMANARNALAARLVAQPKAKEATRISSAVSVAKPSKTTVISPGARSRAQSERDKLARSSLPPHLGGPDNRIYKDDGSVDTEAMVSRSTRRTMRHARKVTRGKRTATKTNSQVAGTRKIKRPKPTIADKAFEQWVKDFG